VHSATRYMTIKRGDYVTVGKAAYKVCKPYSSVPIEALKWCIRKFPSSGAVSCHSSALPCPTSLIIYLKASRTTCKGWKEQGQFSLTPCSRKKKRERNPLLYCTGYRSGGLLHEFKPTFFLMAKRTRMPTAVRTQRLRRLNLTFVAAQCFTLKPTKFYPSNGKLNKNIIIIIIIIIITVQ